MFKNKLQLNTSLKYQKLIYYVQVPLKHTNIKELKHEKSILVI